MKLLFLLLFIGLIILISRFSFRISNMKKEREKINDKLKRFGLSQNWKKKKDRILIENEFSDVEEKIKNSLPNLSLVFKTDFNRLKVDSEDIEIWHEPHLPLSLIHI